MIRTSSNRVRRGLICLLAVLLAVLCLSACSDEILYPEGESLTIDGGGSGDPPGTMGGLQIEVPTEEETVPPLIIGPTGDPFEGAAHVLRVDFLDVGDADCILLRMDGTVILVDTGETADYAVISAQLLAYGITTIDHLIITHYDNDHIGSARSVLTDYTVKHVYMPAYVRDSRLYRNMMSMLDAREAEGTTTVHRMTEDIRLELGYGQVWINPTKLYEPELTLGSDNSHDLQENNYSLITSVTFGEISFLLAGDAEGERMSEFVDLMGDAEPSYDVLKIPHHGRYDKELSEFLRAETGHLRYCVVSVGSSDLVENSLVTAMRATGAGQYYTYNGPIRLATDGSTMTIEQSH